MRKILLCGDRSFAASGLLQKLLAVGFEVDCFSRGKEAKKGREITGDVYKMRENAFLEKEYDAVINFIIIKNASEAENIGFITALDSFCESRKIQRLYQVSSISVYPNEAIYINESSKIESESWRKGGYASVKIAVDHYLLNKKTMYDVSFFRPGFIVCDEKESSLAGICMKFPFNLGILLGDKSTSLPLIDREKMHTAMVKAMVNNEKRNVYLLLENKKGTKKEFLKERFTGRIISLPKFLVLTISLFAFFLRVFSLKQFLQVKGLFKTTFFDSSATEALLGISFLKNSICVIGAGAYGSYIIDAIQEKYPDAKITLFDVGDETIKDEKEIGYKTNLLKSIYTGLAKGRFFGFGGASAKWGGQLLMFTENDFSHPNQFIKDIIALNEKYKEKVFRKFGISNPFLENHVSSALFTKTGVWLGYFSRNLFNYFKIAQRKNVFIERNARVSKFIVEEKKILGIEIIRDGKVEKKVFEYYFLTAGAFESNRILLSSGLIEGNKIGFSDHLSQKVFKMKGKPYIGSDDYQFAVDKTSLITKRMVGEADGISYFANPIFNVDFPFFANLKLILFKHELRFDVLKAILFDLPSVLAFVWSMLVKKKIYVYKNEWHIFIDIENPAADSFISLSTEKDKYGISALDVSFVIGEKAVKVYEQAKLEIKAYLNENQVKYEELSDKIHIEKSEDTYHPYGMALSNSESMEAYFNKYPNLLVVNTGILPRAGGINTTASVFPIVEEYINYHLTL